MADMDIRPPAGSRKPKRVAGRGNSGRRGGKVGKGDKGQNSRSGGGVRPGFEGGQMPLYRRLPRKGFTNSRFKREYDVVNVRTLQKKYADGETVSVKTLVEKRIIKKRSGQVKILGEGELTKKLAVEIEAVSNQAREKIEKAGGTVTAAKPVDSQPESEQAQTKEGSAGQARDAQAQEAQEGDGGSDEAKDEKEEEGSVDGE